MWNGGMVRYEGWDGVGNRAPNGVNVVVAVTFPR